MWHFLVLNSFFQLLYPTIVKGAWVEIPQIPSDYPNNNKPAQFVLGAPKVTFLDEKISTTTPSNHRILTTPKLPTTTLANYKKVMTTSTTITPLTTTPQQINERRDEEIENTLKAPKRAKDEKKEQPKKKPKKEDLYSGFMPLLHSIQETLTLNARKSLKSKISLLTNLRDNLLQNIDEQMSSLWKRSYDGTEARGHDDHEMDFPSNEGALMTIGFLTFAVFLIKLVLKLVHALKNKTMITTTTTGGAATTAATAFIGRRRREVDDFESFKILQFIDEYKFT